MNNVVLLMNNLCGCSWIFCSEVRKLHPNSFGNQRTLCFSCFGFSLYWVLSQQPEFLVFNRTKESFCCVASKLWSYHKATDVWCDSYIACYWYVSFNVIYHYSKYSVLFYCAAFKHVFPSFWLVLNASKMLARWPCFNGHTEEVQVEYGFRCRAAQDNKQKNFRIQDYVDCF